MCARMPTASVLVTCPSVPGPRARGHSLVQKTNKTTVALNLICHMLCWVERHKLIRLKFHTATVTKQLIPIKRRVMVRL